MEVTNEELLAITHLGDDYDNYLGAVVPPIFMNSLHVFPNLEAYSDFDINDPDTHLYGRYGNPTVQLLEKKVAELEHGTMALAFGSGMAAATAAVMATCKAGSHIVAVHNSYPKGFVSGYCVEKLNMTCTCLSGLDLEELESAVRPETALILLESPTSFAFDVLDLEGIANIAKKHHVKTYVDNTWCTPLNQKPLDLGIDISMHSLSKYIGGHSDLLGGILISKDEELMRGIRDRERLLYGGVLGPMEAWLAVRGLRSLPARLAMHQETAMRVAEFLEKHPRVKRVNYTGLKSHPQHEIICRQQTGHTGLMSFVLDTEPENVPVFVNRLKQFKIGCSWGGFESLVLGCHYRSKVEDLVAAGLQADCRTLIRIHCGLEGAENLIEDLRQALEF